jgi:nicotinamide-nucleotide amidase
MTDTDILNRPAACIDQALVSRAGVCIAQLKQRKLTIVTAESCTAGLVSAVLAQAEGAGEVLHGSFVAYSKDQKHQALGVDWESLRSETAVSESVVSQMLAGALAHSTADIGLAVTGVLGPKPDEDGNRVGLVFLAAGRRNAPSHVQRRDYGDQHHEALRRQVVLEALALLDVVE